MKLALIIVDYNDADDVKKYVAKIAKYSDIDRIVIVDNNSPENDFEILQELKSEKIDIIRSETNGGYAYGNNFGINYLKSKNEEYDYYAISNPDIDISQKAITDCVKFLENNKKARSCST